MQTQKIIAGLIVGATLVGLLVDSFDLYDRFISRTTPDSDRNIQLNKAISDEPGLDGMNLNTNVNEYLNYNEFHHTLSDKVFDYYSSGDDGVIVTVSRSKNRILHIDAIKPGHFTNKGIEVGMARDEVEKAYGRIYTREEIGKKRNNMEDKYGVCYPMRNENLRGYDVIEYQSPITSLIQGESADGLIFVVNRKTDKVAMINYYSSMHMHKDLEKWILQYEIPLS